MWYGTTPQLRGRKYGRIAPFFSSVSWVFFGCGTVPHPQDDEEEVEVTDGRTHEKGMDASKAWTIRVEESAIQSHTFALQERDGCFLGAHTKLAGFDKMVRLSTPELAQQYIDAVADVMKKRHGEFVHLSVEVFGSSGRRKDFDDAVVLARMREQNFAPNMPPKLNAF